ncbi:MAG: hypothetical protein JXQ99_21165 [Hyphomicrobiaceae bacterium]
MTYHCKVRQVRQQAVGVRQKEFDSLLASFPDADPQALHDAIKYALDCLDDNLHRTVKGRPIESPIQWLKAIIKRRLDGAAYRASPTRAAAVPDQSLSLLSPDIWIKGDDTPKRWTNMSDPELLAAYRKCVDTVAGFRQSGVAAGMLEPKRLAAEAELARRDLNAKPQETT